MHLVRGAQVVPIAVQQPMYLHDSVSDHEHVRTGSTRTHHFQRRKQLVGSSRLDDDELS